MDVVVKYIRNQEQHHARKTFKEEYLEMLKKFNVEYDERYLFQWIGEERLNDSGTTYHSYGVRIVGLLFGYKHVIPTGLEKSPRIDVKC